MAEVDPQTMVEPLPEEGKLKERFGDAVEGPLTYGDEAGFCVLRERIAEVCQFLRQDPELSYNFLSAITAVDWHRSKQPRFEVVYFLLSHANRRRLRLKVRLDDGQRVPTVTGLWAGANWYEREVFDLFGIEFEGHPNLTKILTPDDLEGHPLRKDYPLTWEKPPFTHDFAEWEQKKPFAKG